MSRKFPLYTQHDAMDCGPTCLRMVASYYGQRYSSQYLREKCFISRQGVSLLGISEAAEHLGMHTIGVQLPLDRLAEDVGIGDLRPFSSKTRGRADFPFGPSSYTFFDLKVQSGRAER